MAKKPYIIDGSAISAAIRAELKNEVTALAKRKIFPGLAVVLVGDNPASQIYVRMKKKRCAETGIQSFSYELPASCSEKRLLNLIAKLNADPRVHGILVQSPVPKQISESKVIAAIDPEKDVDGFHPINVGKMLAGEPCFLPCTPAGCQVLLLRSGINPAGQHVVVVGRSNIVGKPVAAMLMQKAPGADATVTVCHSRTRNLAAITRTADILIAAIGVPRFITADMVRPGVVVIDVGQNRIDDLSQPGGGKLVGDVDYDAVAKKSSAITPVPGGVGPMTIAMLLTNTIASAKNHHCKRTKK